MDELLDWTAAFEDGLVWCLVSFFYIGLEEARNRKKRNSGKQLIELFCFPKSIQMSIFNGLAFRCFCTEAARNN